MQCGLFGRCGEGGIRTPGTSRYNGFQDRRDRPLCHFSGAKVKLFINCQTPYAQIGKIMRSGILPHFCTFSTVLIIAA